MISLDYIFFSSLACLFILSCVFDFFSCSSLSHSFLLARRFFILSLSWMYTTKFKSETSFWLFDRLLLTLTVAPQCHKNSVYRKKMYVCIAFASLNFPFRPSIYLHTAIRIYLLRFDINHTFLVHNFILFLLLLFFAHFGSCGHFYLSKKGIRNVFRLRSSERVCEMISVWYVRRSCVCFFF